MIGLSVCPVFHLEGGVPSYTPPPPQDQIPPPTKLLETNNYTMLNLTKCDHKLQGFLLDANFNLVKLDV